VAQTHFHHEIARSLAGRDGRGYLGITLTAFSAGYGAVREILGRLEFFAQGKLNLQRSAELRQGPMGMQQLSAVNARRFHLRGYAGNTAPDHVDHLHAMHAWFSLLHLK